MNDSQAPTAAPDEKTLEQRLLEGDDFAPPWRGEPGEILIGKVTMISRVAGKFGAYPCVTIQKDDGEELAFHAFRSVAKSELARCRPVLGDEIGILYQGPQKDTDYHMYRIRVNRKDPAAASINWAEFEQGRQESGPEGDGIPF